jgi:hypothetical protein
MALKVRRRHDTPREDAVLEAGREPFNLILDCVGHVHG